MTTRPHGYARYRLDGCRCYTCGYARAQYDDNRNRAIAYGTWQPWISADPVRAHIRTLQECGLGTRRIAETAGVDRKRLIAILNGRPDRGTPPQEKVRPELAAAILAVEPTLENLGAATVIDGTGTRRRLQALAVAGWPQHHLATRLGMSDTNFSSTLGRDHVMVRTARAVAALYDELWRANPLEHGASPCGITRARKHAKAQGWAPAGAWDDDSIDDPAAQPDTGEHVSRSVALAEDGLELEKRQGYTRQQAAARLGVSRTALDKAISRYSAAATPAA